MTDYERKYASWTQWFRARASRVRALRVADRALTAIGYVAYPMLLILLAVFAPSLLPAVIVVPATGFAACTAARVAINEPRPYEAHKIDPLIPKSTRGKSMPSRHATSMFLIAAAWGTFCVPASAALAAAGVATGVTRVLGGVHYPRDVIAAAAGALAWSAIGYAIFL